jgi:hypothetical protein
MRQGFSTPVGLSDLFRQGLKPRPHSKSRLKPTQEFEG